MRFRRFLYFLTFVFVAIILLTVYMQYNSNKNLKGLIADNENLLNEFRNDKDLRDIQSLILNIESRIRGVIVTGDTSHVAGIETEINKVNTTIARLQELDDTDNTVQLVDELDSLVDRKIFFSRLVLQTYFDAGKQAAELQSADKNGKGLTDAITRNILQLESVRRKTLSRITTSLDNNGKKAYLWGYVFLVFVILTTITAFLFIINKIKRQQELIHDLDASEKRVREAAKVKENFLANMSHEIRTPMNAIIGFTHLLERQPLDEKSREYIKSIESSGENLLAIINDILDLSKIEAGMIRIEATPFSVRGMLQSIEMMFTNKMKEKDLGFHFSIQDDVPDILIGDNIRLTQILVNLVSNAVKFTDAGFIAIRIYGEKRDPDRFNLRFEITDTGIGIQEHMQEAVFERFKQAEDATTRQFGGTGLGLSIVKDLVLIQNGELKMQSTPGKGTRFYFSIPYIISPDQYGFVKPAGDAIEPTLTGSARILIAEDNEINQKLIAHLFEVWGIDYTLVKNGRECVQQLQREKFDLVLMDIQMPEMDGYTATRAIRENLKQDIPIIAMTAHAMAGEREKCFSYGMDEHLSKPIRERELATILNRFLKKKLDGMKLENENPTGNPSGKYKIIDLAYMKEVSQGDMEYERTVIRQFLELVPGDIKALKQALEHKDFNTLRKIAHDLKTSISILGLTNKLDDFLDKIESAQPADPNLPEIVNTIEKVCLSAFDEAALLLESMPS
ncbi:MAG: response regulator [Terrimonas sp.]|nr:response regulator [Terrimonas sp.]